MTAHQQVPAFTVGIGLRLPNVVTPMVPDIEGMLSLAHLAGTPAVHLVIPLLAAETRRDVAFMLRALAEKLDPHDEPALKAGTVAKRSTIAELSALSDNWDGDGAPKPSPEAIGRAEKELIWAARAGLEVTEIDADVLGGVAIWIAGAPGAKAWLACMNNGSDTLVLSRDGAITHYPWSESARQTLVEFAPGKNETTRH